MQGFHIGLTGIRAAEQSLAVIGNNIANAATEGYHRQRVDLVPGYSSQSGNGTWGAGVEVAGVKRLIDQLLEEQILQQNASLGQISQELLTLGTIENAFGEFSVGSTLGSTLDEFFTAMAELAAHPSESIWQHQAVSAAQSLASQFRTLGGFLDELEGRIVYEAGNTTDKINTLIDQIAELNVNIQRMEITGGQANNLRDQRDQRITELSELIGVQTQAREYGVTDVVCAGIPAVTGSVATKLRVGTDSDGRLGLAPANTHDYRTAPQGGQLGGLLSLHNEIVWRIREDLDSLAREVMWQTNRYHAQSVGSSGSFTELTGSVLPGGELTGLLPPVTDGTVYIRVTNTTTGQVQRHAVDVDITGDPPDTLTTIAGKIDAITELTASIVSSRLHIQSQTGYQFDFLPAPLPSPTNVSFSGTSPPTVSVSGIYTGGNNQTLEFTVVGSGSVGNGDLKLEARDGAGSLFKTLNIGVGYAAGDVLEVSDGIRISVGLGDLNASDSFEVDVFADTDTAGLLAAVGINTFFAGTGAADMVVCSDIVDSPSRIATSLGAEHTDNANTLRLAGLRDQQISGLGQMSPGGFYRRLVTDIGWDLSAKEARYDNVEGLIQNLSNRRSDISGVDINNEAAQLLVFEQMFQAMAKYLTTVQTTMLSIMEIV